MKEKSKECRWWGAGDWKKTQVSKENGPCGLSAAVADFISAGFILIWYCKTVITLTRLHCINISINYGLWYDILYTKAVCLSFLLIIVSQQRQSACENFLDCSQSSLSSVRPILVSNVPSLAWGWVWKQSARSWQVLRKNRGLWTVWKSFKPLKIYRFRLPWAGLVRL